MHSCLYMLIHTHEVNGGASPYGTCTLGIVALLVSFKGTVHCPSLFQPLGTCPAIEGFLCVRFVCLVSSCRPREDKTLNYNAGVLTMHFCSAWKEEIAKADL